MHCIYIYIHIHMHVYIYIYYVFMYYICSVNIIHVYIYIFMYRSKYIYIYIWMYVCIYICIHIHIQLLKHWNWARLTFWRPMMGCYGLWIRCCQVCNIEAWTITKTIPQGSSLLEISIFIITLRVQAVLIYGFWYLKKPWSPIIGSTWTLWV